MLGLVLFSAPTALGGVPRIEPPAPQQARTAALQELKTLLEKKGWRCSFRAPKDQRPHNTVVSGVVVMTIAPPSTSSCERYSIGKIDGTRLVELKFEHVKVNAKTGERKVDPDSSRVMDIELAGATIHPLRPGPATLNDQERLKLTGKKEGWTDHEVIVEPKSPIYARTIGLTEVNRELPGNIEYGRYVRFGFETKEDAERAERLLKQIVSADKTVPISYRDDAALQRQLRLVDETAFSKQGFENSECKTLLSQLRYYYVVKELAPGLVLSELEKSPEDAAADLFAEYLALRGVTIAPDVWALLNFYDNIREITKDNILNAIDKLSNGQQPTREESLKLWGYVRYLRSTENHEGLVTVLIPKRIFDNSNPHTGFCGLLVQTVME